MTPLDLSCFNASTSALPKEQPLADIYRSARELGLELCPPEAGPQLRLEYLNQPIVEFLHVAMPPVATYGGGLVDLTIGQRPAPGFDPHRRRRQPEPDAALERQVRVRASNSHCTSEQSLKTLLRAPNMTRAAPWRDAA